jgi:hypothetical protein
MKKAVTILITIVMITNTSCTRQPKILGEKPLALKNLDSLLVSYATRPVYYARYGNAGCLFEIRINDVYTEKLTEKGDIGGTLTTINTEILHSGKNTVTVRLYPNPGETVIVDKEPFHLKIGYKDFSLPEGERPWTWVLEMPLVEVPDEGLPYYEYTAEFETKVPYSITGWSDCIDLREIPDIEQRVVDEFKRIRRMFVNQDWTEIEKLLSYKYYDIAVPLYQSSERFTQERADNREDVMESDPQYWQEIEDYELVFYANGRLVTLESKKEGGSPSAILWLKKTEKSIKYLYFDMRIGIRKGTNELIPIR